MKLLKLLPILSFFLLSSAGTSLAAGPESLICPFLSQLSYKGSQWKVQCENGPVYLARWEGNSWHLLAAFDGTVGKYHLAWEAPKPGIYVAIDSMGRYSDSIKIGAGL